MDREQRRKQLEEKKKRLQELRRLKEERNQRRREEATNQLDTPDRYDRENYTFLVQEKESVDVNRLVNELLSQSEGLEVKPEREEKLVADEEDGTFEGNYPDLKLTTSIAQVNIFVQRRETYERETQTESLHLEGSVDEKILKENELLKQMVDLDIAITNEMNIDSVDSDDQSEKELNSVHCAKEKEVEVIEETDDFLSFLKEGVRMTERALKQNAELNFALDFAGSNGINQKTSGDFLIKRQELFDGRYSRDRTVNDLKWSPNHKELLLAAYNRREGGNVSATDWSLSSDPDGIVLLWSLNMPERPEYMFSCQAEVHSAVFNQFDPRLIIGGTYSGAIVLWDLRAKSTPIQHSLLSSEGHTHPIYSMNLIGSSNANSLVTLSTDGKMCTWSLSNLSHPTASKVLKTGKKDIAGVALAFPIGETNNYAVGTEEGIVCRGNLHGDNPGITKSYSGHCGPITALDFQKVDGKLSDILLSCSMDFSVKLWAHSDSDTPIHSFESYSDYVFDVCWSPVNPSLFAACDGTGTVHLWNLCNDLDTPVAQYSLDSLDASSKVAFASDGKSLLIGDSSGKVTLLDISPEIAHPRNDEQTRLESLIKELIQKENQRNASNGE